MYEGIDEEAQRYKFQTAALQHVTQTWILKQLVGEATCKCQNAPAHNSLHSSPDHKDDDEVKSQVMANGTYIAQVKFRYEHKGTLFYTLFESNTNVVRGCYF